MTIETVNPATGELIKVYPEMSADEVASIIDATWQAAREWQRQDFSHRAVCMIKMADLLDAKKTQYARLMAAEMGKPLMQGEAEIVKCAKACRHYAEHAAHYLAPRIIRTEMRKSYVTYQPLGVIFAIMPWNFPFWQVFRFAAPTLMAGNGALLKHAPISTGAAFAIESLFSEAGFVNNLFRAVVIADSKADQIIAHPKVAAVTLTGSPRAGKMVGAEAASKLKKSVLELGGSDPYLILEDADLDQAAEACITSRMNNAGQVCIAAKRLIVVESVQEALLQRLVHKISRYKMGDPLQKDTNFGPLARKDIRDTVHEQVQKSLEKGAKLIIGGTVPEGKGFYYPPTILTHVKKNMPAYDEEIFGPVVAIISVKNEEEAIAVANDNPYGLGAAIFSRDIARAEKIAAEKIEAGTCAINTYVSSDPRLPFGGIKSSGYGRELSAEGILAFVNTKTINVK